MLNDELVYTFLINIYFMGSFIYTYGQFRDSNWPYVHVFLECVG